MNAATGDFRKERDGGMFKLERVGRFQTFLLMANFSVALNLALIFAEGENLRDYRWMKLIRDMPLGASLIFLTGFALYISCLVPTLRVVLSPIVKYPAVRLGRLLFRLTQPIKADGRARPKYCVRPEELLDAGRTAEENAFLDLYDAHVRGKDRLEMTRRRLSVFAFALLLLLLAERILPTNDSLSLMLVGFFNMFLPGLGSVVFVLLVVTLFVTWLHEFLYQDFDDDWVVCPRLYDKLDAEQRIREAELQSTIAELRRSTW
jgi:hypothetical protein